MSRRYLKEGKSSRVELARGVLDRLDLIERGEAIERDTGFECRTLTGELVTPVEDPQRIPPEPVDLLIRLGDRCERATVISGASSHSHSDASGTREWHDTSWRLHATIVNPATRVRCEIERGGDSFDPAWITELREIAAALQDAAFSPPDERRIVLEPPVAAVVMATIAAADRTDWPAGFAQRPRPGERDGRGVLLREQPLGGSASEGGFGWFRPSYRTKPVRIPHSLDFRRPLQITGDPLPSSRVIALYGEPQVVRDRLLLPSLIVDEERHAQLTELVLDPRFTTTDEPASWVPLHAGVWGRRLVFDPRRPGHPQDDVVLKTRGEESSGPSTTGAV